MATRRSFEALVVASAVALVAVPACSGPDTAPIVTERAGDLVSTRPDVFLGGSVVAGAAWVQGVGDALVDGDGRTLYVFANDSEGVSTCRGVCAVAWPPVTVPAEWTVTSSLDADDFSTLVRDDGSLHLMAEEMPLYRFSGDFAAGDIAGDGMDDVWFVATQP